MSTPFLQEQVELVLRAIDDELELPGPMPDDIWENFLDYMRKEDREAVAGMLRLCVRQSKRFIRERFLERIEDARERSLH